MIDLDKFNNKKELDECLDLIKIDTLREFVKDIIINCYNKTKLNNAIKVTKYTIFLLENDGMINNCSYVQSNAVIVAGALLHNVAYDYGKQSFKNLFNSRDIINKYAGEENEFPYDIKLMLYQLIECQLGKSHPVKQLIPTTGNPAYYVALACSLYYKKDLGREIEEQW